MYMNISILRILATLAVVFLHTNSGVLDRPDLFPVAESQEFLFILGKQAVNWAVPVFLMITGALMLKADKEITLRMCIVKYVKRVILALFCFGIPFALMELFIEKRSLNLQMLFDSVICVLTGNSWAHLWYLYMLIGFYLVLPIFKRFIQSTSRTELQNILVVLFIFQVIIPFIESLSNLDIAFDTPFAANVVFYPLLGKYLSDELPVFLRCQKRCVLSLSCSSLIFVLVCFLFHQERWLEFFALIHAVLIFSFFRNLSLPDKVSPFLWRIDRLCFGVYLIHPLFINFAYKFLKITPASFNNCIVMIFLFFLIFSLCSFCASLIMSMIPPLKKHIL